MGDKLAPGVTIRLCTYLRVLRELRNQGVPRVSSQEMSEHTSVNPTQVRRDLSAFGRFGKRGVGYDVDALIRQIEHILHAELCNIAVVGAGRLGTAIALSSLYSGQGLRVVAVFDKDPHRIDDRVGDLTVLPVSKMASICPEMGVLLGVIATPPEEAQDAADALIGAGVRLIFNYTEALFPVPDNVCMCHVNPAQEMLSVLYRYSP